MADHRWKAFKKKMKVKRQGKSTDNDPRQNKEEIVVQRLNADVTGEAQKYSRIEPREFGQVGTDELTIEKVKTACIKHFAPKIGSNLVGDILAGEQGPSCSTIKQVRDLKLMYVRFINEHSCVPRLNIGNESFSSKVAQHRPSKRKCEDSVLQSVVKPRPHSVPSPRKVATPMVPRSISVTQMLKLGKVVKSTQVIDLFQFDVSRMTWSTVPKPVEFSVSNHLLGEGAFRKAYTAETVHKEFSGLTWVIKEYNSRAVDIIGETNQTVEAHTKKVVQMHCLAQNFASQCKGQIEQAGLQESLGKELQYGNIYLGKKGEDCVTVEEYVEGDFDKYINNDGAICYGKDEVISSKAECLAHFSYEKSNHELMLLDIQGCGYRLFDPEIASTTLMDGNEILFTTGNLSKEAIDTFIKEHVCNVYCNQLKLQRL